MVQMPTNNGTTWLREHAHNAVAIIGALLFLQSPVTTLLTAYAGAAPIIPFVTVGFGALGALVTLYSKYIDSRAFTDIQVAQAQQLQLQLPSSAQDQISRLEAFIDQASQVVATLKNPSLYPQPEKPGETLPPGVDGPPVPPGQGLTPT